DDATPMAARTQGARFRRIVTTKRRDNITLGRAGRRAARPGSPPPGGRERPSRLEFLQRGVDVAADAVVRVAEQTPERPAAGPTRLAQRLRRADIAGL